MSSPMPLQSRSMNNALEHTPLSLKRKADASSLIDETDTKRGPIILLNSMERLTGGPSDDEEEPNVPRRLYNPASSPTRDVKVHAFKIPAIPERDRSTRLTTPATSTVAASSSPPRALASSEIDTHIRGPTPILTTINLTPGELTIFGRHHAAWNASEPVQLPSTKTTEIYLDASLPRRAFNLPRNVRLASRCHAAIQVLRAGAQDGKYRLVVFGQNGVRVRFPGSGSERYKRMKVGQKKDLDVECEIDFGGCAVRVCPPATRSNAYADACSSPTAAEREMGSLSPPPSLPSSSPPVMPLHLASSDDGMGDEVEEDIQERSRHRSPLFDEVPAVSVVAPVSVIGAPTKEPEEEAEEELTFEEPLPEDVDLPAILANTVVFSGSSKLSLPDLVRHMLETAPSLKEQASEAQWRVWSLKVLENEPMFGKVQRNGKDASGHPLLPHYFYSPDADTDANRAKELGGLVRPLRAAQRAGGKPLDWRPVGSGRRRY